MGQYQANREESWENSLAMMPKENMIILEEAAQTKE